jgi:carboxymethylenebutenolidase
LLDREIIADVDTAVAHLDAMPEVVRGVRGVIGFCMGGRNTYLLAGARPALWRAAGVFYGGNITRAWGDGPSPFDRTDQIACPMIGFFGRDDANPSPADVAAIDAALARHGKPHEFHSYDGAGHAFLNFTNPERHRPAQAADAWPKLLAFLDRHLTG